MKIKEKIRKNNQKRLEEVNYLLQLNPKKCGKKSLLKILIAEGQIYFNEPLDLKKLDPTLFEQVLNNIQTDYPMDEGLVEAIFDDLQLGEVYELYLDIDKTGRLSAIIVSNILDNGEKIRAYSDINHITNLPIQQLIKLLEQVQHWLQTNENYIQQVEQKALGK
ncbi:MAG: hypothetical protein ACOCP4_03390 [Candidatus Woesearchaeota archaeon]